MKITVKLFAQYREGRFKEKKLEITKGTTISQIIEELGLDTQRHPIGILLVDGKHADLDHTMKDGETLSLFPKVGGG
jgi:molybdopterin converting factor small subunit